MDFAISKRKVYVTSNQLGFSVLDFIEPGVTPNFFVADIEFENARLFVLGSGVFIQIRPLGMRIKLHRHPKAGVCFSESKWH